MAKRTRNTKIPAGSHASEERQPAPAASTAQAPAGATDAVSAVPLPGEGTHDGATAPLASAVDPVAVASATDPFTAAAKSSPAPVGAEAILPATDAAPESNHEGGAGNAAGPAANGAETGIDAATPAQSDPGDENDSGLPGAPTEVAPSPVVAQPAGDVQQGAGAAAEKGAATALNAELEARFPHLARAVAQWQADHAGTAVQAVRVKSKAEGFRRGGLAHTRAPIDHPVETLTMPAIEAMLAEPMLTVELI